MNKPMSPPTNTYPMRSTAVNFTNGMIVTDTDLTAAMQYPIQLMQMTNRAVYGCGVACGFTFTPDAAFCGKPQPCDPCGDDNTWLAFGFKLQVGRGTAIDCFGMPIELCEPVLVDIEPDKCGCSSDGGEVCIAIRRVSAKEAPRGDCCSDMPIDCARVRDHVELMAFPKDDLPDHICAHDPNGRGDDGCDCGHNERERPRDPYQTGRDDDDQRREICKCLMTCDPCECCGDGWVLLGCVTLCKSGVEADNFERDKYDPKVWRAKPKVYAHRRYIKTIDCSCRGLQRPQDVTFSEQDIKKFHEEMRTVGMTTERNMAVVRAMNITDLETLATFMDQRRDDAMLAFGFKDDKFDQVADSIRKKLDPDQVTPAEKPKEPKGKTTPRKGRSTGKKEG